MIPKVVKKTTPQLPLTEKPRVVILKRKSESSGTHMEPTKKPYNIRRKQVDTRTKRAINLVVKGGISKAEAMRRVGFSKNTAKNPKKVFGRDGVKDEIKSVIAKLELERDAILKAMPNKRKNANYAVLSMALKNVNHDLQLLSGNATERIDAPLSEEEKSKLNNLIAKNK